MQELFAVGTSFVAEALFAGGRGLGLASSKMRRSWPRLHARSRRNAYAVCHDDGADHAGAQVALLAGGDEAGHGCAMDGEWTVGESVSNWRG